MRWKDCGLQIKLTLLAIPQSPYGDSSLYTREPKFLANLLVLVGDGVYTQVNFRLAELKIRNESPDIPREIWRYKFLRICDISSMRYTYGAICPKGQEITGNMILKVTQMGKINLEVK